MKDTKTTLLSSDYILITIAVMGTNFVNYFFFSTLPIFAGLLTNTVRFAGFLSLAFSATALVIRPLFGFITDRYGRVKWIIAGAAICAVSCMLYSFTTVLVLLLLIRILNGIGMSSSTTSAGAAIPDIIPKEKLAEGLGIFGLGTILAQALGPTIALSIVAKGDLSSFKTLFYVATVFTT